MQCPERTFYEINTTKGVPQWFRQRSACSCAWAPYFRSRACRGAFVTSLLTFSLTSSLTSFGRTWHSLKRGIRRALAPYTSPESGAPEKKRTLRSSAFSRSTGEGPPSLRTCARWHPCHAVTRIAHVDRPGCGVGATSKMGLVRLGVRGAAQTPLRRHRRCCADAEVSRALPAVAKHDNRLLLGLFRSKQGSVIGVLQLTPVKLCHV